MKANKTTPLESGMRNEYSFAGGERGRYASRLRAAVIVSLDPDVARLFPDSESVNKALRSLADRPRAGANAA